MKIAVAGKGGVGKTTIAGTLARLFGKDGKRVLAVDMDPSYTLWSSIGIPEETAKEIVPLTDNEELLNERLQIQGAGSYKSVFKLNPRVDDLTEEFVIEGPDNVALLVGGTVEIGGSGCMCPSATLLKALMRHLVIGTDEAFVMDLDAGIEHLGRGTTRGIDALIVVVEPSRRSLEVLSRIKKLAHDIDVGRVYAVGNKIENTDDEKMIRAYLDAEQIPLVGMVPLDQAIRDADRKGIAPIDLNPTAPAMNAIRSIKNSLLKDVA